MMTKALPIFLVAIILSPIHVWAASDVQSKVVDNLPITSGEADLLDPVCRLILVDQPGAHGYNAQRKNAALFTRPEYEMAKDAIYLHHRCWAMVEKNRSGTERNQNKRRALMGWYFSNMDYVLQNAPNDWKFRPQILVEVGNTELMLGDAKKALASASKALAINKSYGDAYVLLANAYQKFGNKEQLKKIVGDGLLVAPTSKALVRYATKLGLKIPESLSVSGGPAMDDYKEDIDKRKNAEMHTGSENNGSVPDTTIGNHGHPISEVVSGVNPESVKTEGKAITRPDAKGTKRNPYCRFCP